MCSQRTIPGFGFNTSRELLIASLLIASALVFYAPVVKIPPANTSIFAGCKSYRRRTALSCASDNYHTSGASTQNAPGISLGGPTRGENGTDYF
jgi:hypothetical protein